MQRPNPGGVRPGTVRLSPKARLTAHQIKALVESVGQGAADSVQPEPVPHARELRSPELHQGLVAAAVAKRERKAAKLRKSLPAC